MASTRKENSTPSKEAENSNVNMNINDNKNDTDAAETACALERKRKASAHSMSECDTSVNEEKIDITRESNKKTTQKKKKPKGELYDISENEADRKNIQSFSELNSRLNTVVDTIEKIASNSSRELRETMKNILSEMKDSLLESVSHRIEILEGKLFDKDEETDKLTNRIQTLEKEIEAVTEERQQVARYADAMQYRLDKSLNEAEQYSRLNNIRVRGVIDTNSKETPKETTKKIIDRIEQKMKIEIDSAEIDIAHRLKKRVRGNRDIIVRFTSRMLRDDVMRSKKMLKGTGVYLHDDLTTLNQAVYHSVRLKKRD